MCPFFLCSEKTEGEFFFSNFFYPALDSRPLLLFSFDFFFFFFF